MPNYATTHSNVGKTTADVGLMNPYLEVGRPNESGLFGQKDYQHDLQAATDAAELQLMRYQNEYNSYYAQAQRMREAGFNPDLLGASGESAAGMQGGASPANINAPTAAESAIGFTSTVLSIISGLADGALGAAHKIEDLNQKELSGFIKALGIVPGIGDTADDISSSETNTSVTYNQAVEDLIKSAPRRDRGMLRDYTRKYFSTDTMLTSHYGRMTNKLNARGAYARTAVSPATNENAGVKELMECLEPVQKAEFEVTKELLKGEKSKAEKMSAYWMNKDMGLQAEMENSQAAAEKGQADIMETIRQGALQSIGKLEKAMEAGKWWEATALSAIYASLQGMSVLPNISHSSSDQSRSNQHGSIENHSNSWTFGF
ncbi:MAG: hypothetical protein IJY72_03660 [Akkermansia sp.]|nr:hypothetical protein [Akkermansia sp.]